MLSIGLMSGTSMDGVDAALLETDGEFSISVIGHIHLPYPLSVRNELKTTPRVETSTDWHIAAVQQLLQKTGYCTSQIDVIGYHGQTLFHKPSADLTIQIGDGQRMANHFDIPVISNFRQNDIDHGGQGAPFAPLYHHALAVQNKCYPVAIVNCGGIANITLIPSSHAEEIIGFDTGPGNTLIDRYVQQKTTDMYDQNGKYGLTGKINNAVLEALEKHHAAFLSRPPPKSLDLADLSLLPEIDTLSIPDACATLAAFTAKTIVESVPNPPAQWIIAGGGAKNPVILRELQHQLPHISLKTADDIGWNTQSLEAELFAWLAVRSLRNLPLSLPNITGVSEPISGGTQYLPQNFSSSNKN